MSDTLTHREIMDLVGYMNEEIVGGYFRGRNYQIERLDEEGGHPRSNCDWKVDLPDGPFLCEVKTVTSVRRGDVAQADFRTAIENRIRHYFDARKDVRDLPFHLHFHSDKLQLPRGEDEETDQNAALNDCLRQITDELRKLSADDQRASIWYCDDCCNGTFDLVVRNSSSGRLEIEISPYGSLNRDSIEDSLSRAIGQLNRSGEDYPELARISSTSFRQ